MIKTLILYATIDGQTKKICEYLANHLSEDHDITLGDLAQNKDIDLSTFDKVIIGGSVRYGRHHESMEAFLTQHKTLLNAQKTALFSVNATARKAGKNTPESNVYFTKLIQKTQVKAKLEAVFAGKIHLSQYGWFDRFMIKLIFRMGGETLGPQAYEFTDWQQVERFALRIQLL